MRLPITKAEPQKQMQTYSDPARESNQTALPDVEVWYHDAASTDCLIDPDGDPLPSGWYWWTCFPGCLPDGLPNGPFETEADAIADAQDID